MGNAASLRQSGNARNRYAERDCSGWGQFPVSRSRVYRPEKISSLRSALDQGRENKFLARGLGRSYGDAATHRNEVLLLTERLNRFLSFDEASGLLRAEAGVNLREVADFLLPRGWFAPVVPGTEWVTLGGAFACDIHGKNHHRSGSFANHVRDIQLLLADGKLVTCSPKENSEEFWASAGGMGLTGIILELQLQLKRVETAYLNVETLRLPNLESALSELDRSEEPFEYSVCWLDCQAKGKDLGRSIWLRANHASISDLPPGQRLRPLEFSRKKTFPVPFRFPGFFLNRQSAAAFNAAYYRRVVENPSRSLMACDEFFYPLDRLGKWHRLYGKRGFIQYQCAFPAQTSPQALSGILSRLSASPYPCLLGVLKRFGPGNSFLSFPIPGYTLAVDMPVGDAGFFRFLGQLDEWVIQHGGRVYLAKDSRLSAESFRRMYPEFSRWQKVKSRLDPENRFQSDLSRRLKMSGGE